MVRIMLGLMEVNSAVALRGAEALNTRIDAIGKRAAFLLFFVFQSRPFRREAPALMR